MGAEVLRRGVRAVAVIASVFVMMVATGARAADHPLLARARREGAVRVLAQMRVPEAALAERHARTVGPERRHAIRGARARVEAALGDTAWEVRRPFAAIPFVALEVGPEALERLLASGEVISVEEDRLERVQLGESIPLVQADQAEAAGADGSGWTVAVLDTGVDSSHTFLAGRVVGEACFSANGSCPNGGTLQTGPGSGGPCNFAANSCGHGTHVAGIVAGRGTTVRGVAPGASLLAIQVFSRFTGDICDDDTEDPCAKTYTSDTVAALEHVLEMSDSFQIAAVNMSLGGGQYASEAGCDAQDGARKAIIDALRGAEIATIAAAGNQGAVDALAAPGCLSSVISVGATTDGDTVASFSNSAPFLDLLAPGVEILSSVPGEAGAIISGTSQAVPHVAGAFAILNQRLGRADVDAVLNALRSTGAPVFDSRNGLTVPRIRIYDALLTFPGEELPSGLQITPDGKHTLISKDVGAERWAITANADDGTVTGNVFKADGGVPSFVWCQRLDDDGNPDERARLITFACSGADACEAVSCPQDEWVFLRNVNVPGSFFLPPLVAAPPVTPEPLPAVPDAPSGLQITPEGRRTLISKDQSGERWAITVNQDDGSITGNVFRTDGREPAFLWCSRTSTTGGPDPSNEFITFACQIAERCTVDPCSLTDWRPVGDVTLPGWFLLP